MNHFHTLFLTSAVVIASIAPLVASADEPYYFDERKNRMNRLHLFWESQPVTLKNCTLKRYGSPNDGGYLLCADLLSEAASAYSYGIEGRDQWGCDVSKELNIPVHEYDCFDPRRPLCEGGRLVFHDECVSGIKELIDDKPFDTVENQILKNGDAKKRAHLCRRGHLSSAGCYSEIYAY